VRKEERKRKQQKISRPKVFNIEEGLGIMKEDELLEITPKFIRIRKQIMNTKLRRKLIKRNKL
jgi:GTP-binding protein